MTEVKHRGHTIIQSDYNNHYMIYDGEGKFVCHAQCTEKLTEEQLKEKIDIYIELVPGVAV